MRWSVWLPHPLYIIAAVGWLVVAGGEWPFVSAFFLLTGILRNYDQPAAVRVLVLAALFFSLVAISYGEEPPHECGKGPVTITAYPPRHCNMGRRVLQHDEYVMHMGKRAPGPCDPLLTPQTQRWTTWPECGGTRMAE